MNIDPNIFPMAYKVDTFLDYVCIVVIPIAFFVNFGIYMFNLLKYLIRKFKSLSS